MPGCVKSVKKPLWTSNKTHLVQFEPLPEPFDTRYCFRVISKAVSLP
jgi:hypothetical protein